MRTLFTALAFLMILWAVIPAVRRSMLPSHKDPDANGNTGRRNLRGR